MRLINVTAFTILLLTNIASAKDLATYRATYEVHLDELSQSHRMSMTELGQKYTSSLDALLAKVKKAGDLDRTTAVMAELERLAKEESMPANPSVSPDIRHLQSAYAKQASRHERDKARKIVSLTSKYDQVLERLQKRLVSSSKLDDAKAVQAERRRVEKSDIVISSMAFIKKTTQRKPAKKTKPTQGKLLGNAQAPSLPIFIQKDILLHYSFDQVKGNKIIDSSGHRNDGTMLGAELVENGRFGKGVEFGQGKSIDAKDFRMNNDFTISLWLNLFSTKSGQSFIGKHTSGGGNIFLFGIWGGGYHVRIRAEASQSGVLERGWQHLVVVGDSKGRSTDITVYRDGEKLWNKKYNTTIAPTRGKPWTLGQEWDEGNRTDFLDGALDEVIVFKRALGKTELNRLFQLYLD